MPPWFASRRWRTRGSRSHSNDGGRLSYAELDALSDRFAAGLRASGLPPGERVPVQVPNIPQFLVAYFGTLKAGCVAVPLNVLLMAPELVYCLGDAQARRWSRGPALRMRRPGAPATPVCRPFTS